MSAATLALFCRVIDNFGDIGVCWRLARQLAHEYKLQVQLWVDDLVSFQKLCPAIQPSLPRQYLHGIEILLWNDESFAAAQEVQVCDMVIEGFACSLPEPYLAAMLKRSKTPIWINLEYLSAEAWVESCHGLPSPHPQSGMLKYFYFPGFTPATGGLLAEHDLTVRRQVFQENPQAIEIFWQSLGVQTLPGELKISMFCYPHAPLLALFQIWQQSERPILCLLPQGVAQAAAREFFADELVVGQCYQRGALRVHILPFVAQEQYDQLLWASDINFVRGEDSFVRAQWAARPFVWQIYPQQDAVHLDKLDAFLQRYEASLDANAQQACGQLWRVWNQTQIDIAADGKMAQTAEIAPSAEMGEQLALAWQEFLAKQSSFAQHAEKWAQMLAKNGDLAARLMQFMQKIG